jgi:hypothetical protein
VGPFIVSLFTHITVTERTVFTTVSLRVCDQQSNCFDARFIESTRNKWKRQAPEKRTSEILARPAAAIDYRRTSISGKKKHR